jgi:beta-glucosidase
MAERRTIRDIARLARVSTATVSRVLNQRPDVDPATRERILRLIVEVGYHPDHAATVLANAPKHKVKSASLVPPFPPGFLWGVSTSALQIEGALADDGRGPSIWDDYVAYPAPSFAPQTAAIACDHYHRMSEDVALLQNLGVNAYRFSIAWSRVMPEGTGYVNPKGLDFYDRLVDTLLQANITPLATLYHWDLPLSLQQRYGGWVDRRAAYAFADFAEHVSRRLGDRVSKWMTVNEPWSIAVLGYVRGEHPPYVQDWKQALQVAHHLLLAHGLAVPRLRRYSRPDTEVGISLNVSPVYPADRRVETSRAVHAADLWHNRWLLDPIFFGVYPKELESDAVPVCGSQPEDLATIAAPLDFVGISYYSRLVVRPPLEETRGPFQGYEQVIPVPEASYSQMGWEIFANGLHDTLLRVHRDYHPPAIVVTENGVAFNDAARAGELVQDRRRVDFLREHIAAMHRARQMGVPVRGYCVWTLIDNFEWTHGYQPQFGLIALNRVTQQRNIKESGRWYRHFISLQSDRAVSAESLDAG